MPVNPGDYMDADTNTSWSATGSDLSNLNTAPDDDATLSFATSCDNAPTINQVIGEPTTNEQRSSVHSTEDGETASTIASDQTDSEISSGVIEPAIDDIFPIGWTVLVKLDRVIAPARIMARHEIHGVVRYKCQVANIDRIVRTTANNIIILYRL